MEPKETASGRGTRLLNGKTLTARYREKIEARLLPELRALRAPDRISARISQEFDQILLELKAQSYQPGREVIDHVEQYLSDLKAGQEFRAAIPHATGTTGRNVAVGVIATNIVALPAIPAQLNGFFAALPNSPELILAIAGALGIAGIGIWAFVRIPGAIWYGVTSILVAGFLAGSVVAKDQPTRASAADVVAQISDGLLRVLGEPVPEEYPKEADPIPAEAGETLPQIITALAIETRIGLPAGGDLSGGNGDDLLFAGSGADRFWGEDGNDRLLGDGGDDSLAGGRGNDILVGGPGVDHLWGHQGDDLLLGDSGADQLIPWSGNDTIGLGDDADVDTVFLHPQVPGEDLILDFDPSKDRLVANDVPEEMQTPVVVFEGGISSLYLAGSNGRILIAKLVGEFDEANFPIPQTLELNHEPLVGMPSVD